MIEHEEETYEMEGRRKRKERGGKRNEKRELKLEGGRRSRR